MFKKILHSKYSCIILFSLLTVGLLFTLFTKFCKNKINKQEKNKSEVVTILFTSDMHSSFFPKKSLNGVEFGGYARLSTLLQKIKEKYYDSPAITVDAGDWSMGSLFETISTTTAAELRILGNMNYDVTTFGNHEYDFRKEGLAHILNKAISSGDNLPKIVQANYFPSDKKSINNYDSQDILKIAFDNYGVTDYTIVEKNGARFAIFGILGEDAYTDITANKMKYENKIDAAKRVIKNIKDNEKYDYIICLSHSGINDKKPTGNKSEDYELAKNVSDIDVIVSGHTHSTLEQPIKVKNTYIVACGEYAKKLGMIRLKKDGNEVKLIDYNLFSVDNNILEDNKISKIINSYKDLVNQIYLKNYKHAEYFDKIIAKSTFDFEEVNKNQWDKSDKSLCNLITDSYQYAIEKLTNNKEIPVDFSIVPAGIVRNTFYKGNITVSDVFDVLSLGIGADGTAGYPLVDFYLTGKELKTIFEIDASISDFMTTARIYGTGMKWKYNLSRVFMNKVVECYQVSKKGVLKEIGDNKLYRVVTGQNCAQMVSKVKKISYGLISMIAKDKNGCTINDGGTFDSRIIYDKNGFEIKEWYALASYLSSFDHDENDTISKIPEKYRLANGNKQIYSSLNICELLKKANVWTYGVIFLTTFLLLIIIFLFFKLIKYVNKRIKLN